MSTRILSLSAWAWAVALGGFALGGASARADDDCYYRTRYTTRHVYVDPAPVYRSVSTAVVYDSTPGYVRYTRTYARPTVTYVEPYVVPTRVVEVVGPVYYDPPIRYVRRNLHRTYHYTHGYGYGYRGIGRGYYRDYGARGWGFGVGRFSHSGHHGYRGHHR